MIRKTTKFLVPTLYLLLIIFWGWLGFFAHAQTAKVIELKPADTAEAKTLFAQRDAINAKIDALHNRISVAYLQTQPHSCCDWILGFEFSDDFKYIVPIPPTQGTTQWNGNGVVYSNTPNGFDGPVVHEVTPR